MRKFNLLFLIFVIFSTLILATTVELTILDLNDTHGHAWSFNEWHNPSIGGFAAIATLVDEIRKEVTEKGGHVLFLHAGDLNTGVPESDLLGAEPDIVALNMMGLDAMVIGNHEFDNPIEVLLEQMAKADFQFISANIVFSDNGMPVFQPYVIKDLGGFKVAILGLTTKTTEIIGNPKYIQGFDFLDPIAVAKFYVPILREKADFVIALTHLGIDQNDKANDPYGGSVSLAKSVDGIDVIVDGHSHTLLKKPLVVNNTLIIQAGDWGKYLGRLDLMIEDGKIRYAEFNPLPINLKKYLGKDESGKAKYKFVWREIPEKPEIKEVLDKYKEKGLEKLNEPIGETKVFFNNEYVRAKDNILAHLITDAVKWKTGVDVVLQNGGGIRAAIKPGVITYRDILTVLPFGNTVVILNMTGEQLLKVLDYAAKIPDGKGAKLQVAGLSWIEKEDGVVTDVKVNGEPIDPKKVYKVATNDYMANGGDGYTMLKEISDKYDTGYVLADVVKEYIQYLGTIESYDGEVRWIEPEQE